MKNNGFKYKGKKRLKFRHIYTLTMAVITVVFAWHVLDLLVITPIRATGLVLGTRMDAIEPLETSWLLATEDFGATLGGVDEVSVFWNTGPVVYISVRVEPGSSRTDARNVTREIVDYFIEVSDDVALQYDIQVVASYGNITEQIAENHAAVLQHTHTYNHGFAEAVLSHAEQHPSQANFDRAYGNINSPSSRLLPSIIAIAGEEGLDAMRARLSAIDLVEEEDVYIPEFPQVHQIPPSDIGRFPLWGTWDTDRSRIRWN
ncbi:MAG: hypothetical protein FWG67_05765 [Defluviitaleaceae bacterium]|nr:hypothetical protein [Defluviitaleaceae bacterium]